MLNVSPSSAEFFEQKYMQDADPWKFETNTYELGRYRAIVEALGGRRYRYVFEPGCSIGVLTERLAMIAGRVDACDFSETASSQARARCAHLPHVNIRCASLSEDEPWHRYDLIVLSEIGYYFSPRDWSHLTERMTRSVRSGTTILAVHWLGQSSDHVMSGDEVQEILRCNPRLAEISSERSESQRGSFRMDIFERRSE